MKGSLFGGDKPVRGRRGKEEGDWDEHYPFYLCMKIAQ
jgi:hypothetical protein